MEKTLKVKIRFFKENQEKRKLPRIFLCVCIYARVHTHYTHICMYTKSINIMYCTIRFDKSNDQRKPPFPSSPAFLSTTQWYKHTHIYTHSVHTHGYVYTTVLFWYIFQFHAAMLYIVGDAVNII